MVLAVQCRWVVPAIDRRGPAAASALLLLPCVGADRPAAKDDGEPRCCCSVCRAHGCSVGRPAAQDVGASA